MSRKIIVLDPGHAKNTPGKRSPDGSLREYEFAQDIANKALQILSNYDVKVILTKNMNDNDDTDLGDALAHRVNLANNAGANIFISIHGNAAGGGSSWMNGKGFEIFWCTGGHADSENLAKIGSQECMKKMDDFGIQDRGIKTGDFYVIHRTHMPSVLCEFGFYDNKPECGIMKTNAFRIACAEAVANTAIKYLSLTKPVVNEAKPTYKVFGNTKTPEVINVEKVAYARGWALFNAGATKTYLIDPDGNKYTFSKHPEANPNK